MKGAAARNTGGPTVVARRLARFFSTFISPCLPAAFAPFCLAAEEHQTGSTARFIRIDAATS